MTARRDAVVRTRERILDTAYRMWLRHPYDDVTLEKIADAAGVARQTLHRQFGSKEALFLAMIEWRRPQEDAASLRLEPGDVAGAVRVFVDRYERMGDALVRFLTVEGRIPAVDRLLASGRTAHRAEIEHAFGPQLAQRRSRARTRAVNALYAATDVMVWKLLRRDFGLARNEAEATMRDLVAGVLRASSDHGVETR